jgi:sporulation protein YlmC with PRC-barrel domain
VSRRNDTAGPDGDRPFDLRVRLLDHQVVDPDGGLVCKVDDVEFEQGTDGAWRVSALLCGPQALGPRLPGRLGQWVTAVGRRLSVRDDDGPQRIPFERVTAIGSSVQVDRTRDELAVAPLERWVREHVVRPIPGSGHEGE